MVRLAQTPSRLALFGSWLRQTRDLLDAGHPHRAAARCVRLQRRAARAGCAAWAVAFGALRAEALLREGDLTAAEWQAARSLRAAEFLGATHCLAPAAVLAEVLTHQGRLTQAERHLRELPEAARVLAPDAVPGHLTHAVFIHLQSQGRHHLAAHRLAEALAVFVYIGRLGRAPSVPWRTGAAEALLAQGHPQRAARLLTEQLTSPGPAGPRVCGIALRLMAATQLLAHRPHTLARAVRYLRTSGDRLELARAYADFAAALALLGEREAAAVFRQRAHHLAGQCGAAPPCTPAAVPR